MAAVLSWFSLPSGCCCTQKGGCVTQSWLRMIAGLILTCAAALGVPAAAMPSLPVAAIEAGKDGPALSGFIRYTKQLGSLDTPIEQMLRTKLQANRPGAEHFGLPGQRTAMALRIRNTSPDGGTWILTTGRGSLRHFRLYEWTGQGFALLLNGSDPVAAQNNLMTYQAFSTELVLAPGEEKTIVIDFLSENSTYMPLKLQTYGTFFQNRRTNIAMVSGVLLAVAVLIFLNFVFFSVTGHREFGWLALAQVFLAISTVHTEGYLTIFLLADSPLLSVAIEDGVKCAFAAAMAQFARSFLTTATRFPRLDKALIALIAAALVVIALQAGLSLYGPGLRTAIHSLAWVITGVVALFLPVVGVLAVRSIGRQLWPLLVGWASLALFIIYGAIASMGVFKWLPINWHLIGPVGFFEVLMVTLALGLNLRKIQTDRQAADARYNAELAERVRVSERAAQLAEDRKIALAAVDNQNALLHASGHDSKQVILALNSAITVLKRQDTAGAHHDLTAMLQSSVDYLSEIAATTMSGAAMVGSGRHFHALSAFRGENLLEPLLMMFKAPFAGKGLTLAAESNRDVTIISDRPLLMRALANLLSNSHRHTLAGGARMMLGIDGGAAVITIADTGTGIPDAVARELLRADPPRLRAGDSSAGTGSGFRSARRIIEGLGGTLTIPSTGPAGTTLRISLPCAHRTVAPCTPADLAARLNGQHIADFDRRAEFDAAIAQAGRAATTRLIAATYDDTSVTRERLSEAVAMMLIKPLCREMADHPALQACLSDQA